MPWKYDIAAGSRPTEPPTNQPQHSAYSLPAYQKPLNHIASLKAPNQTPSYIPSPLPDPVNTQTPKLQPTSSTPSTSLIFILLEKFHTQTHTPRKSNSNPMVAPSHHQTPLLKLRPSSKPWYSKSPLQFWQHNHKCHSGFPIPIPIPRGCNSRNRMNGEVSNTKQVKRV